MIKHISIDKSLNILRNDAIKRGMLELAITYGWSQIRVREDILNRQLNDLEKHKLIK